MFISDLVNYCNVNKTVNKAQTNTQIIAHLFIIYKQRCTIDLKHIIVTPCNQSVLCIMSITSGTCRCTGFSDLYDRYKSSIDRSRRHMYVHVIGIISSVYM